MFMSLRTMIFDIAMATANSYFSKARSFNIFNISQIVLTFND